MQQAKGTSSHRRRAKNTRPQASDKPSQPCAAPAPDATQRAPSRAPTTHLAKRAASRDAIASEAIELFAWLLSRSGYSREHSSRLFKETLDRIPASVGRDQTGRHATADDAAHIVTLWHMTDGYIDERGEPIALPARGAAPSIEALARLANRDLTIEAVMDVLCATHTLRQRRGRYVPVSRAVSHKAATPYQAVHHLRVVTGLLRTAEHNARPTRGWLEWAADGLVPAAKRRVFQRDFRNVGLEMLQYADALMLRHAAKPDSKAPKVPLTIGVYMFEDRPLPPQSTNSKSRAKKRSTRGAVA